MAVAVIALLLIWLLDSPDAAGHSLWRQIALSAAVVLIFPVVFLVNFARAPALVHADDQAKIAAAATQFMANARRTLEALRGEYILSHDGISPGIAAGTEPLPSDWVNQRLEQMGQSFRVDAKGRIVARP